VAQKSRSRGGGFKKEHKVLIRIDTLVLESDSKATITTADSDSEQNDSHGVQDQARSAGSQ